MAIDTEEKRRKALNSSFRGQLLPVPVAGISFDDRTHVSWAYYSFNIVFSERTRTYTHLWAFGDGEYSTEENPSHVYSMPGVYTVSHTVTDEDGNSEIEVKEDYITVYGWDTGSTGRDVSKTNRCYRFGFTTDQGLGFSECSGDSWPTPEARCGVLSIYDDSFYPHLLVLDCKDGMLYDIATFDGPDGSGLTKVWKDKVGTDNTGGTEIIPEVLYGEDIGGEEDFFLRALQNYFYTRPIKEENRDVTGFDDNGYPDGLSIDVSMLADGEPETVKVSATDIVLPKHMISFDKKAEGNRLQAKITANMSGFRIMGRAQHYVSQDTPADPTEMLMNHDNYQEEFSIPLLRVGDYREQIVNLATGIPISLSTYYRNVYGPDQIANSAISFDIPQNIGSVSLSSGTIMLWYQGVFSLSIGGVPVVITQYSEQIHYPQGAWTLGYASNVTASGIILITPTGNSNFFDIIAINSAISAKALEYYYNNAKDENGNIVFPRF
jgi:PKD repeat protein